MKHAISILILAFASVPLAKHVADPNEGRHHGGHAQRAGGQGNHLLHIKLSGHRQSSLHGDLRSPALIVQPDTTVEIV